jgi:hypothetical protein
MADVTNANGYRAAEATAMAAKYFFTTLHGSGGSALAVGTTYSAGVGGELSTALGYTQGGFGTTTVTPVVGSVSGTYNVVPPTAVWTASGGSLVAYYAATWVCDDTSRTNAKLVMVKDSSGAIQTATTGSTMTVASANIAY